MAKSFINPALKGYERDSFGDEDDDGEISSNFPVEIHKPRNLFKKKSLVDRLHLTVWGSEEDQIRNLVVRKGTVMKMPTAF